MTPPGLAFASVSLRAWERAARATLPRYYLDWRVAADSQAKNDTAFTPAVTIVAALHKALELIESRGPGGHLGAQPPARPRRPRGREGARPRALLARTTRRRPW